MARDYDCHLGDDPETVGVFKAAYSREAAESFRAQLEKRGNLDDGARLVVSTAGSSELWVYMVTGDALILVLE